MSIERAATQDGYPVGPLQLSDELEHGADGQDRQGHRGRCGPRRIDYAPHPGTAVVEKMLELGGPRD